MALVTHLVVAYNHETKTFEFDEDGSDVWIRGLFLPESNTWSDEEGDYVGGDEKLVKTAVAELNKLLPKSWSVWVGGSEINNFYLSKKEATTLAKHFRDEGYDDVSIQQKGKK